MEDAGEPLTIVLPPEAAGERLDKALATFAADLSRARVQALIGQGRLTLGGEVMADGAVKARSGVAYTLDIPPPILAEPQPQPLPLSVLFEDAHLIVVDKPAGMAAHPAPGTPDNTLVNALLSHCAGSLSGVGGVLRPGIVHRLDKNTSGVMVAAKTDVAHRALSALFARHDIERAYVALTRGAPHLLTGTIRSRLGRSSFDRKKMAVVKSGGREAVTHYAVERLFTAKAPAKARSSPIAARIACRLETGRTHQLRVHLASKGAPCLGDPVYGSGAAATGLQQAMEAAGLHRQALHAGTLGFVHPVTGEPLKFATSPPSDFVKLETELGSRFFSS